MPNYRAFYLNIFLASKGYNEACTKLFTEACSVSIKFIKVIKIYERILSALSSPFLFNKRFSSKAVVYYMMKGAIWSLSLSKTSTISYISPLSIITA